MKSFRRELWFETKTRVAFVNITDEVQACVAASGVREGLCLVNARGSRCSTASSTGAGGSACS